MPKLTALIHVRDNVPGLPRTLDSLTACDEVLLINHAPAAPEIDDVARQHGAKCRTGVPGVAAGAYLIDASNDWILCMLPGEVVSKELAAAIETWKQQEHAPGDAFACVLRDETGETPRRRVTRLVNRTAVNWTEDLPPNEPSAQPLAGELVHVRQA